MTSWMTSYGPLDSMDSMDSMESYGFHNFLINYLDGLEGKANIFAANR